MQFEAEWHSVPPGLLCCLAGIYNKKEFYFELMNEEEEELYKEEIVAIRESTDMVGKDDVVIMHMGNRY